jgi:hypothetical protein
MVNTEDIKFKGLLGIYISFQKSIFYLLFKYIKWIGLHPLLSLYNYSFTNKKENNCISGVMVSVRKIMGSSPLPIKTNGIRCFCFSAKHTAIRKRNQDWLTRNKDNVSEWSDISTEWASTIKNTPNVLIYYKTDIIISSNVTCSRQEIAEILLTLGGLGLGYGT